MISLSIVALFALSFGLAGMVILQCLAQAVPAWRESRAALAACPTFREAWVSVEEHYIRTPMPRARAAIPVRPMPRRRFLRSEELNAAA